jgi:hypothetical protein
MFLGDVISWLDPALVELNPQLTAWFTASNAPVELQLIVGASSPTDAMSSANLLFDTLKYSDWAAENAWAFVPRAADSNPFLPILERSLAIPAIANFTLIDIEDRLSVKVRTYSGAVGYRPIGGVSDPTAEFQWAASLPAGADPATTVRETIPSSTSALKMCGAQYTNPAGYGSWSDAARAAHMETLGNPSVQRNFIDFRHPDPGCWPLSSLVSFVAKTTYSTAVTASACNQGLRSLEFINYIATSDILSLPAESFGLVRLGEFPAVEDFTSHVLRSATCDGSALLVIPPLYWTVNTAITGFGQAMAALGLLTVTVSFVLVLSYRHKVVIRSSSVPFLCVILVGMGLLLAAMIPWAVVPTEASCSSFLWLVNLGFMLLFCPLFAKTWRVYRIFSGAHLKVVKISNVKLLLLTSAVVALDIILIGVWQGVSPLVPVQYDRMTGSAQHVFTHCSVKSSGAGLIFAALVGVEKSALLLFGAIMAFSTRNVKGTFNESAAISWTIYNTLMSALIGVAIIVFVSAVEDALVLLVLILLTWIVLSAWGLIFGPKFHLLMQSDEKVIEASRSQITQEKSNGFSFASIAAMTTGQVKQFYVALKLQVNKAERVLQLPQTLFGTGAVAGDAVSGGPTSGGRMSHQTTKKSSGLHNGGMTEEQSYAVDITPVSKDREAERERNLLITVPVNSAALSVAQPASPSALSSAGGGCQFHWRAGFAASQVPCPSLSLPVEFVQAVDHSRSLQCSAQ